MEENGMGLTGVGTPQKNDIRLFNLGVTVGAATHAKNCRQTDDAWRVSGPVTTVDVVATHHLPAEFLRNKIHLVSAFRATEDAKSLVAMLRPVGLQGGGYTPQRLFPGCLAESGFLANQWLCQTRPTRTGFLIDHVSP
jgi:hypothetical protein